MVDFILRHGNDLLAVECLRGFEVRMAHTRGSTSGPGVQRATRTVVLKSWEGVRIGSSVSVQ